MEVSFPFSPGRKYRLTSNQGFKPDYIYSKLILKTNQAKNELLFLILRLQIK